jgi:TrpR family trp operon transcriptional repressor
MNKQNELIKTLLEIKDPSSMLDFLKGILTPAELQEIPTRLQIVRQLKKGIDHHTIAKNLKIGVATVTRGSKEIQKGRFKNI